MSDSFSLDEYDEALSVYEKSSSKEFDKINYEIDHLFFQEYQRMKKEAAKKKQQRLMKLLKQEEKEMKRYERMIRSMDGKNNEIISQWRRIQKILSQWKMKQEIGKIASTKVKSFLTRKECEKIARDNAKEHVLSNVERAREVLKGSYLAKLEEFSRIPANEEYKQVHHSVSEYIKKGQIEREKLRKETKGHVHQHLQELSDGWIDGQMSEIQRNQRMRYIDEFQTKVRVLLQARHHVDIPKPLLIDHVRMDAVDFQTDIGVHDKEMKKLQDEIMNLEEDRQERVKTLNQTLEKESARKIELEMNLVKQKEGIRKLMKQYRYVRQKYAQYRALKGLSAEDIQKEVNQTKTHLEEVIELEKELVDQNKQAEIDIQTLKEEKENWVKEKSDIEAEHGTILEKLTIVREKVKEYRKRFQTELSDEAKAHYRRYENRPEVNAKSYNRQKMKFNKQIAKATTLHYLSRLYKYSLALESTTNHHLDNYTINGMFDYLMDVLKEFELNEVVLRNHCSFLRSVINGHEEFWTKAKNPKKTLKKLNLAFSRREKAYAVSCTRLLNDVKTSELMDTYRRVVEQHIFNARVCYAVWKGKELSPFMTPEAVADLPTEFKNLSDHVYKVSSRIHRILTYFKQKETQMCNHKTFFMESPLMNVIHQYVEKDDNFANPTYRVIINAEEEYERWTHREKQRKEHRHEVERKVIEIRDLYPSIRNIPEDIDELCMKQKAIRQQFTRLSSKFTALDPTIRKSHAHRLISCPLTTKTPSSPVE